jgi:choline dehydrogenase-like flavoprotein
VDGLEGLIVADASVLPVLPHAGPVPAVVAVGELAVDEILAELTGRAGSSSDARWGN